jgi:hypothetical protein
MQASLDAARFDVKADPPPPEPARVVRRRAAPSAGGNIVCIRPITSCRPAGALAAADVGADLDQAGLVVSRISASARRDRERRVETHIAAAGVVFAYFG